MKKTLEVNSALFMFLVLFFLSAITFLLATEFRFLQEILTDYEESLRQVGVKKTTLFLNELRAASEGAAREFARRQGQGGREEALETLLAFDRRLVGASFVDESGSVVSGIPGSSPEKIKEWPPPGSLPPGRETSVLGMRGNGAGGTVATVAAPLEDGWLVLDYSLTGFRQEMIQEFLDASCKVAVFDQNNNPVVWPFSLEELDKFTGREEKFSAGGTRYAVSSAHGGQPSWHLYFFFRENNFDTYRMITIMFLLFALYCCLYQFLVELWRVNSARSYFENIDFTIFDAVKEGVIISNNAGRIIFANQAAHEIFRPRKADLKGVPLKEILGWVESASEEKNNSGTLTLKMSGRLLEAVHSPIIKKGKVLGSVTVLGASEKEGKTLRGVLDKLIDILPVGVLQIDRHQKVARANLMARCYLGSLEAGMSIDEINPELAGFIYRHMGSRSLQPVRLNAGNLAGEMACIYDEDGIYAGALLLVSPPSNGPAPAPGNNLPPRSPC